MPTDPRTRWRGRVSRWGGALIEKYHPAMLGMCHCIPMVLVSHRVSYMVCRSAFVVIVILVLFDALMHTFFSHFHLLPVS